MKRACCVVVLLAAPLACDPTQYDGYHLDPTCVESGGSLRCADSPADAGSSSSGAAASTGSGTGTAPSSSEETSTATTTAASTTAASTTAVSQSSTGASSSTVSTGSACAVTFHDPNMMVDACLEQNCCGVLTNCMAMDGCPAFYTCIATCMDMDANDEANLTQCENGCPSPGEMAGEQADSIFDCEATAECN